MQNNGVDHLVNHPGILTAFSVVIIIMLLLDLGVFNKKSHVVSNKEAAIWSIVWISLAMGFSGVIYYLMGIEQFKKRFLSTTFLSSFWFLVFLMFRNICTIKSFFGELSGL